MKKKTLLLAIASLGLAFSIFVGVFWYHHPTYYRFNDRYIIDNTKDHIIEKYGEPHSAGEKTITYMIRDNTPDLIMSYDNSLWYVIDFEDDVAVNVYLRKGYVGG